MNYSGYTYTAHNVTFAGNGGLYNNSPSACTLNDVSFAADGTISGSFIYNGTLTMATGKTYTFDAGQTQTFNNNLVATGACGNNIMIQSSSSGSAASFVKTSGNITIDFVTLKDINATGGATFKATNSTDGGGNSNWNIIPQGNSTNDYYWFGGTGNWNDPAHWSFTAGSGRTANTGGCIPGQGNNVFFDQYSFTASSQSVTVTIANAYCADMNWTGATNNPAFYINSACNMHITGSLTFISAMSFSQQAPVYFEAGTTGKTITCAGKTFGNEVYFNQAGGEWTMQDALVCYSWMYLRYGTLRTNNNNLTVNNFDANNSNTRGFYLGSSVFTISGDWNNYINFTNMTFDAGTSSWVFPGYYQPTMLFYGASSNFVLNDVSFTYVNGYGSGRLMNYSGYTYTAHNVTFAGNGGLYNNSPSACTLNDVSFAGDGTISGSYIYNGAFSLSAGKTYIFDAGQTQTFNGSLVANGNSGLAISIQSSNSGSQAVFSKSSGCLHADWLLLRDNMATGGATFYMGSHSIDNGNNSGWTAGDPPALGTPGAITGNASPCLSGSGYQYSIAAVSGASTYNWTLPSGASITSGAGTASITVDMGTANSGSISVTAASVCQTSTASTLALTFQSTVTPHVSIVTTGNPVCPALLITYTATPVNGGLTPAYQWKVNGSNTGSGASTFSYYPTHNDVVSCLMMSNATCPLPVTATSNAITQQVIASQIASVVITPDANPFCPGNTVNFTATPTDGGSAPIYAWKVNGGAQGTNSPNFSYAPVSGDQVRCIMTSNAACVNPVTATSNLVTMTQSSTVTPGVSIVAGSNPVCASTSVQYTATPSNAGPGPHYAWYVNNVNQGVNNAVFNYTPTNGVQIKCILTSNLSCASPSTATSNIITMTVNPWLTPSVTVSAGANSVCAGTTVSYTATPTNGGSGPVYSWKVNGGTVGTNSSTYSYIPSNNDLVKCILTSNYACPSPTTATSNTVTMVINPILTPSVTITASNNPVYGTPVTFTATPVNGGSSPTYQWKLNGNNTGNNTPTYTYTPAHNDVVACVLTSNVACPNPASATSNAITMTVYPPYYWVGGSGNWSEASHWSTTSGGPGGAIVPGVNNTVYFDANSGFTPSSNTVTVDVSNASCRNMNWTGATNYPAFTTNNGSYNLRINGSLTLIAGMNYSFSGTVYFESSSSGQTITSAGQSFNGQVYFNAAGGEWILQDDFICNSTVYLNYGTFRTNNKNVTTTNFNTDNANVRGLYLGSSLVTINYWSTMYWQLNNLTLDAGTSTISFPSSGSPGIYVHNTSGSYTFNDIEFTNPASNAYFQNQTGQIVTCNNVSFAGHGYVSGNNNYNGTLSLAAGHTYQFESGRTQHFNSSGNLSATGYCGNNVVIQSTSSGSVATFSKASGNITINYISLTDNSATGGATFTSNNTTTSGIVNGWTINTPSNNGVDYYWIGGSGNWGDAAHWSLTSGGTANPAGCIPGTTNNVFFNSQSGFTPSSNAVTVDVSNASCRNMDWTGATNYPTFSTNNGSYSLHINGLITLIASMNYTFSGTVYFEATTSGQTITSAGQSFNGQVYFNAAGGEWILQDDFICNSTVYLNYGTFRTNNKNVTTTNFNTDNANVRGLYLGSSLVTINYWSTMYWQLNNLTLDAGTSTISFPSSGSPGIYVHNTSGSYTFYNIEFTNPASNAYFQNQTGQIVTYNNVSFAGHGYVSGNNNYNGTLSLAAGHTYQFESGRTQQFNSSGNLSATGYCGNNVVIQSTSSGSVAYFGKASGNITINYISLTDNYTTGNAVFTANNTTISGLINGWHINTPNNNGVDYYWIGGSGNWSDAAHWSLTSGGTANPAGCIPGTTNNVFFNSQSGFTPSSNAVTVDVSNASCRNMDWTGATNYPTFSTNNGSYSLHINGLITLIASMNYTFSGTVYFEATTSGQTITSAGQSFNGQVYFNAAGGEWILQDDFICNSTVYLNYGTFRTNNKNVTTTNFNTDNANVRGLYLGSSLVTINYWSTMYWQLNNLTLDAGTSTISFPSSGSPGIYVHNTSGSYTFYNIEFTNPASNAYFQNQTGQIVTYNNVSFAGHGYVSGSNTYNGTLSLAAGHSYQFESGRTQRFNNDFIATGSSGQTIQIFSTNNGSAATFSKATGCVILDYVELRDNSATGGANWYAGANSVDQGNASGWSFISPVGGTGGISASITASPSGTLCPSTSVVYTATLINGGSSPTYQWKYNGSNVGGNTPTYSAVASNNDSVRCVVISSNTCATPNTASSNKIINAVTGSSLPVSVAVTSSISTTICPLSTVVFNAAPTNGGSGPAYAWKLNGTAVGSNSPTYSYSGTWINNDQVKCVVTSNLGGCVSGNPATSNTVTMSVANPITTGVSISAAPGTTIAAGTNVVFTAAVTNGGANPTYQWKVNGNSVGTSTPTYSSFALTNNNTVTCEVTSSLGSCVTPVPAVSNTLTMTVTGSFSFYWIGGTGNWSQPTHWSFISGGPACGLVPGSINNVYFDANSGFTSSSKTVTLDVSNAACKNMDWTGATNAPVFNTSSGSNNLMIFGSLTLIPAMNYSFSGQVYFEATTTGKTITSANKQFQNTVVFDGAGGEWTLLDDFKCNSSLQLNYGSLVTNNVTLTLGSFSSTNFNTRSLTLGSSLMVLNSSDFSCYFNDFTINAGTSTIRFTSSNSFYAHTSNASKTFYNVEFTNPNANYTFYNNSGWPFTFHNVSFASHANFYGTNTFNVLSLTGGKTYNFPANTTQTIITDVVAGGSCGNTVVMQSNSNGTQATFSKTSGTITVDYVTLKDMNATGGATWNATNSTVISNVSGWNVTVPGGSSSDYYWIGGTGNWSQASHWSLSSGGTAGTCIPGSGNNVFFDANSGFTSSSKTVTVDVSSASCRNMDWTGATNAPIFNTSSGSNNLMIYGSLTLIPAMNYSFSGQVYFEATTTGKTITSANKQFQNTVVFDGAGGEWTLLDDFKCNSSLQLNYGSLVTNNVTLTLGSFSSTNFNTRSLTLGSSLMVLNSSDFSCYFNDFTINAGTSTIRFTSSNSFYAHTSNASKTFYNVEFTNPNANYTFYNNSGWPFTFHNVSFASHANFYGTNTFNVLSLTGGKTYNFPANTTQTIITDVVAGGSCGNTVVMQSNSNGTQATFSKTSGTITVDYVTLKDMNATGGATWNATNSTVISNVSGWNVTVPGGSSSDYYWIGGTGNWSQASHWSLSSGGTAGTCIPGSGNNVFFDANSGFTSSSKTVTVDVSSASCRNMDWTGATNAPVFNTSSGSNNLMIYGSLTLIPAMNYSFSGQVYFEATTTGKTITSANKQFQNTVVFDGAGGEWTLLDDFKCNSSLQLNYGSLVTNNVTLTLGSFSSTNFNTRSLTLGSSLMVLNSSDFSCYFNDFTINAGTSTIRFTSSNSFYAHTSNASKTFYNVEFTNPNANYTFYNNSGWPFTFHNVSVAGHANFYGSNTFNDLTLSAGHVYSFPGNATQTFNGTLSATGLTGQAIDIHSSNAGTQATFSKVSGCVILDYVQLRDINAQGGANWYAGANSNDNGNNTGWSWTNPASLGTPGSITGSSSVCAGSTGNVYSIAAVSGAGGYTWTVPTGASITSGQNTTSVTVNMGTAVSGSISVVATNLCFTSVAGSLTLTINPLLTPAISVAAGSNPSCSGSAVIFTATPVNGGTSPGYQWKVNNINQGAGSSTYSYNPANNDQVKCILVSNATCPQPSTATSNTVTMSVTPLQTPSVSIAASSNPSCSGNSVSYTATPVNGGASPAYQWKVNGSNQGTSSPAFAYIPTNNDAVICLMTSNASCVSAATATSNSITMTVNVCGSTVSWTGAVDSDWNNGGNWAGGLVPLVGTNVDIPASTPHQPEITSTAKCNTLSIASGATLTIKPNWSLSVYGATTLNGAQCLIIKSTAAGSGSFIDNGTILGAGTAKIERYITANLWHYISPVIPTATAGMYNGCYLKKWAEVNYSWTNIISTSTPLNVMVGYALKSNTTGTYNYIGKPNTGTKTIALTKNSGALPASKKGWNFVGNPYPSTVNWDTAGWTKTNMDNAIYIYNQTYANYATYVNGVGTNGGNKFIAAGQGFYVVCNNTLGGSLSITNNVRLHYPASFFKSSPALDLVRLTLSHKGISDDIVVRIDPSSTNSFDSDFDAYKIIVPELSQLWSSPMSDREANYSINTLPDVNSDPEVAVSMVATEDGTYTIKATDFASLSLQTGLFLEDLKTGTIVNLSDSPEYTFGASTADDVNRFILHFAPTDISRVGSTDNANGLSLYPSPNKGSFTITAAKQINGASRIEIYNIMGEVIYALNVNDLSSREIKLNEYATGVYYAKIITEDRNQIIRFVMNK